MPSYICTNCDYKMEFIPNTVIREYPCTNCDKGIFIPDVPDPTKREVKEGNEALKRMKLNHLLEKGKM